MERAFSIALCIFCLLVATPASGESPEAGGTQIISRIKRESVQSTALAAVGYSKHLRALEVEFINGAIYRYLNVPRSVHRELM